MPLVPERHRRRPAIRLVLGAALLCLATLLAGCGGGPPFDPTGPCTADGSAPGAYPDLEALIPATFRGVAPDSLDSGRACTPAGLGTLAATGLTELRFAGGTWTTGTSSGVSLALFRAPDLTADQVGEFYGAGARAGRNIDTVETTTIVVGDATGRRVDALNNESYQTIVAWPRGDDIAIAIVGSFIREIQTMEAHEVVVQEAIDAFGG